MWKRPHFLSSLKLFFCCCGETKNTRGLKKNTEKRIYRFFLATYVAREYDITVARRALVPRESPGTHKNTRIITYSLVAAFLFTF